MRRVYVSDLELKLLAKFTAALFSDDDAEEVYLGDIAAAKVIQRMVEECHA